MRPSVEPGVARIWRIRSSAGCHVDSIRRAEKKDLLPNTRQRSDGTTEVAVADLVAAGMLDPLAAHADVTEVAARSRTERDLTAVRQELAVANAQLAGLADPS
ncbi:MAG: hypothetical protein ACLFRV_06940 [Acidimicrobiales bacterium]